MEYLTVQELATALKISLTTAYAMVRAGEIRSFKVGNQYRIPVSALKDLEEAAG